MLPESYKGGEAAMIVETFNAKCDGLVALSDERWEHILLRHPEMREYLSEIGSAIEDPDGIIESESGSKVYIYQRMQGKVYITVIVNVVKRFVLTAYVARWAKGGKKIWERT